MLSGRFFGDSTAMTDSEGVAVNVEERTDDVESSKVVVVVICRE